MGKKNRNQPTTVTLIKGTILEQFEEYFKSHRKKSDIIKFLSIKNAQLLNYAADRSSVPQALKDELCEFYLYFMEEFDELTYEERMYNWNGTEPLILRMGGIFFEEQIENEMDSFISSIPKKEYSEAVSLCELLFSIRHDRSITVATEDAPYQVLLDKIIPKDELAFAKKELLYVCALGIHNCGGFTIRYIKGNIHYIFGVGVDNKHKWYPVDKDTFYHCMTTTPTGQFIDLEDYEEITEIKRPSALRRLK